MYNATEQFAEINKASVAQATKLAALSLATAEKFTKFNLLTAKSAFAQGVEGAQSIAAVRDVQQLFALSSKLAEAGTQAALGYSKNLYELATEAQAQYTTLVEDSVASYAKGATTFVDQTGKSTPAGSQAVVNAFRQGLAASTAAFDQFNKASRQVVNLADASVRAAAANSSKAVATTKGRKSA
jgi:phasin family protein